MYTSCSLMILASVETRRTSGLDMANRENSLGWSRVDRRIEVVLICRRTRKNSHMKDGCNAPVIEEKRGTRVQYKQP